MKISQMQVEEILEEEEGILIQKHPSYEGAYRAQTIRFDNDVEGAYVAVDGEDGPDIGELINELHSRL